MRKKVAKLSLLLISLMVSFGLPILAVSANKHGQVLLAGRVENEQVELSKNFRKWEKLRVSKGKISERMDLVRIGEQIEILLQKRNYLKSINKK